MVITKVLPFYEKMYKKEIVTKADLLTVALIYRYVIDIYLNVKHQQDDYFDFKEIFSKKIDEVDRLIDELQPGLIFF